ncbi:MAG: hypothetical protein ABJB76_10670 [Candidatus Nitrosocosmicus sp.]
MDKEQNSIGEIFDKPIEFEFEREDVNATMTTMTYDAYVLHVPTLTGGSVVKKYIIFIKTISLVTCQKI